MSKQRTLENEPPEAGSLTAANRPFGRNRKFCKRTESRSHRISIQSSNGQTSKTSIISSSFRPLERVQGSPDNGQQSRRDWMEAGLLLLRANAYSRKVHPVPKRFHEKRYLDLVMQVDSAKQVSGRMLAS